MKTLNAKDAPTLGNPHGVRTSKLYDTKNAQVVHVTMAPGESLKKHLTPVDVFFYVLEGTGVVEIGDEKKTVGRDTLVDSPVGMAHCWHNESNSALSFLVVKVPRPTEATKLL